jgi:hypothetical protein
MIDDRIVDMKRAVPESFSLVAKAGLGMTTPAGAARQSMPMSMQALYSQQSMFCAWAEDPFYCGNGYACLGIPDAPTQPIASDSVLDCVHLLTCGLTTDSIYHDPPAEKVSAELQQPMKSSTPAKVPLGEVTNTIYNRENLTSTKKLSSSLSPLTVESDFPKPYKPGQLGTRVLSPASSEREPCFIYEDSQALAETTLLAVDSPTMSETKRGVIEEASAASTGAPSEAGDLSPDPPSIPQNSLVNSPVGDATTDMLPSAGSARHAFGECRRCNFFAKGRCRNGYDCIFCHLPHERRKLSRQEKREQQAARQAMMQPSADASEDSEAESNSPQKLGPLLSPLKAEVAACPRPTDTSSGVAIIAEPFAEPSPTANSAPVADALTSGAGLPPGLRPPGLPPPQTSPTGHVQPSSASPFFPPETGMVAKKGGLLSTSPTSAAAVSTRPKSSGRGGFLLSTSPTAAASGALQALAKSGMQTVATQTDDDFKCPYCKDSRTNVLDDAPLAPCAACSPSKVFRAII